MPTTRRPRPAFLHALTLLGICAATLALRAAPVHLVDEKPVAITVVAPGVYLVDFGRVAFGNIRVHAPIGAPNMLTVFYGEDMVRGRVNRQPAGTVRYATTALRLQMPSIDRQQRAANQAAGVVPLAPGLVIAPKADVRNTWDPSKMNYKEWSKTPGTPRDPPPPAILTPKEWDVVLPFRWVEIEGWPGELRPEQIFRQSAFASTWDDNAAAFNSSDAMLNRVWELCRYSIKATTFAGLYVDGDRERIPYEADAYLNQLSHYTTDSDVVMARDTYDHLMIHGTWPTEWASHMVFMAHADWWHTGDRAWIGARYDALRAKLLLDRVGDDGLVASTPAQSAKGDIVDWPNGERDGFVFTARNAVVNAFYLRALEMMIEMGHALGRDTAVTEYTALYQRGRAAFQTTFFDPATGLCRDGLNTTHSSLHANLFAYRFGLVPEKHQSAVVAWLQTRGMDCSVYVAQYYMEALFQAGAGRRAVELMLAPGDRSWRHMVESGATISWEAWDLKYKPNQDWNHAWGAAPANLLPRFVLGAEAAAPGWSEILIRPDPSGLTHASGKIPTPRGAVLVEWRQAATFTLSVTLPADTRARLELPATAGSTGVFVNQQSVLATRAGARWIVTAPVTGTVTVEVK